MTSDYFLHGVMSLAPPIGARKAGLFVELRAVRHLSEPADRLNCRADPDQADGGSFTQAPFGHRQRAL